MQKAIIVDLDGTLANTKHREKYVKQKPKNFKMFHSLLIDDTPNIWCVELIKSMRSSGYEIIFLTGRDDNWKKQTMEWLRQNNIDIQQDRLLMRRSGDHRPDFEVKKEFYESTIKDKFDILFAIDDRTQVVDMWRDIGITCLQCARGDF